mgnify:CR=1 FL=1
MRGLRRRRASSRPHGADSPRRVRTCASARPVGAQVRAELLALAGHVADTGRAGTPPLLLQTPSGGTLGVQSVGSSGDVAPPPDGWRGSLGGRAGLGATALLGALAALSCVFTVGVLAATHEDDDDDSDDDSDDGSEAGSEAGRKGARNGAAGAPASGRTAPRAEAGLA